MTFSDAFFLGAFRVNIFFHDNYFSVLANAVRNFKIFVPRRRNDKCL